MKHTAYFVILFCLNVYRGHSTKLPGPLVYVVTPSSRPSQTDTGRAAPFYYHNWMRRMDSPGKISPSTSTTTQTPDLIFAEFESGKSNMKSIRNLLQKEKHKLKTSTFNPIYVPDEEKSTSDLDLPQMTSEKPGKIDMTDYFALHNNLYNSGPMYVPSAPTSSVTSTPATTTTTEIAVNNVENVWHIIDNEKHDHELSVEDATTKDAPFEENYQNEDVRWNEHQTEDEESMDDNFALPGFEANPGNDAENESRAIRTESNMRFPYVNLKPFIMKNMNSKKSNNLFGLDSLREVKYPIRGEVQDTHMVPIRQPIDRYNAAQPYLPSYGTKSKKPAATSAPPSPPQTSTKVFANLVPPPPPAAPQITADDFPTPRTYESFPPYAPSGPGNGPSFSFPSSPTLDSSIDYGDGPPSDFSSQIKPPSVKQPTALAPPEAPALSFMPTLPPLSKPFSGYSYDKPPMVQDDAQPTADAKPDFQGYHYSKPSPPSPPNFDNHDTEGDTPYHAGHDYPDLIFDKPHGMQDMKGGDSGKDDAMGMMPPPLADTKPDLMGSSVPDHGFPQDFPGGYSYGHDFDDHDFHHHHYHPTTTTTTEQPRVNRYSYYYLGKKLYYLPLYFSVYFIIYVGALIIKAVLRHKITYPNSFRPNDKTASFFAKRSVDSHLSNDYLHEITGRVTKAIAQAAEKYISNRTKEA